MENNELLQAISNMMDQKLDPIKSDVQMIKEEQAAMKGDIQAIKEEQTAMKSDLQMQMKCAERNLRAEIIESENLILQEVSRVHHILNDHIENRNVHTA